MEIDTWKKDLASRIRLFHFGLDLYCAVNIDQIYEALTLGEMIKTAIVRPVVKVLDFLARSYKTTVIVSVILFSLLHPSMLWLLPKVISSGNYEYFIGFIGIFSIVGVLNKPAKYWLKLSKQAKKSGII